MATCGNCEVSRGLQEHGAKLLIENSSKDGTKTSQKMTSYPEKLSHSTVSLPERKRIKRHDLSTSDSERLSQPTVSLPEQTRIKQQDLPHLRPRPPTPSLYPHVVSGRITWDQLLHQDDVHTTNCATWFPLLQQRCPQLSFGICHA